VTQHPEIDEARLLNAYIDHELDDETRAQVEVAIRTQPEIAKRHASLLRVRTLFQHTAAATRDEPRRPATTTAGLWREPLMQMTAASLLVAFGAMMGWIWRGPADAVLAVEADQVLAEESVNGSQFEEARTVFHLTTDDRARVTSVLNQAEQLLALHEQSGRPLRIEILANAKGLDVLRIETSPYRERITSIQARHMNVSFVACGTALQKLRTANQSTELLPGVMVTPSALDEALQRVREGWTYIKV
jgi:intracellular sulfur oxidation DsrE/DsrF family protein